MLGGLLGKKLGMTQIFDETGRVLPVTVIEAGPCPVLQIKRPDTDGYEALQLGFEDRSAKGVSKPLRGHFASSGSAPKRFIKEIQVDSADGVELGQTLTVELFEEGEHIDVTGRSIGRGFAGGMKRHGFKGKDASHGTHKTHRKIGSIGAAAWPSRVFRGKRMPGHYGASKVTVKNIAVVKVVPQENLLLLHGAVPGPQGGYVVLRKRRSKG